MKKLDLVIPFFTLLIVGVFLHPSLYSAESLGGLTLLRVSPRVFTPNGDGHNDVVYFQFDTTLTGLPLESSIMDVNGAKVADMTLDSDGDALTWNGKDENGRSLQAGIYIYSIKIGKNLASGTVVLAK